MKDWKAKLERYGNVGIAVHLSVFASTLELMVVLLNLGVAQELPWLRDHPEATSGATMVAAYALTKLAMGPRWVLTLTLTPLVLRWMGRTPAAEPAEG